MSQNLDYFRKGVESIHKQQNGNNALFVIVKEGDELMVALEGNGGQILNCLVGAASSDPKIARMLEVASDIAKKHHHEFRNEMEVHDVSPKDEKEEQHD